MCSPKCLAQGGARGGGGKNHFSFVQTHKRGGEGKKKKKKKAGTAALRSAFKVVVLPANKRGEGKKKGEIIFFPTS